MSAMSSAQIVSASATAAAIHTKGLTASLVSYPPGAPPPPVSSVPQRTLPLFIYFFIFVIMFYMFLSRTPREHNKYRVRPLSCTFFCFNLPPHMFGCHRYMEPMTGGGGGIRDRDRLRRCQERFFFLSRRLSTLLLCPRLPNKYLILSFCDS